MKIAVLDVQYQGDTAFASLVSAFDWIDAVPAGTCTVIVPNCHPYVPGQFYKRELPPLLSAIRQSGHTYDVMVVDSYVWLDEAGTPGLGAHLHQALQGAIPVVGIAKTAFQGSQFALQVLRGASRRPLYVTAVGIEPAVAARQVASMHGGGRIPDLVRFADRLARAAAAGRAP